jgi:hypothetical protein
MPLWLCAIVLIAIGGAVSWGNRPGNDSSQVVAVQSETVSSSLPQDDKKQDDTKQDDTKQAVAALQEAVKGAAEQISDLQRQLKVLSDQIGALAARVDSLERPGNPFDSLAWVPQVSETLSRFGDWTITKNDAVITLYSGTTNLAVRCSDNTITYLAFIRISDPNPSTERAEIKPPPYFDFTAWADSNEPAEFTFLVGNASDAYATGILVLNPKFADQNTKFWTMLKSARSRFSYNTGAATISMNAAGLSTAIARFQEECFKIFKANAHHRLNAPIPLDWLRR